MKDLLCGVLGSGICELQCVSTCVGQIQSTCSLFWRQTRAFRNQSPRVLETSHRDEKTDRRHKCQPLLVNHYWPWPMRSPGQYRPSHPPPLLPLSTQPSERSPFFLLNLNGGEVQHSTHRVMETSSQSKLYQPPSRPQWSRLLKPQKAAPRGPA